MGIPRFNLSVLPVIVRELRAQARQPLTYWLRLIGGLALAGAIALTFWTTREMQYRVGTPAVGTRMFLPPTPNPYQTIGIELFGKMNLFIFAAIWLFVPLAAADAVSRERREGTLPLLYLTELRAFGILIGKTFVHFLRSSSLFLTMAPWLMLPVLLGGVELRDIRIALLLDFASVLLAMAAGLLASTFPRDWLKSVVLAELLAATMLLSLLYVHGSLLGHAVAVSLPAGVVSGTRAFWTTGLAYFTDLLPGSAHGGPLTRITRLLDITTNSSWKRDEYPWFGNRMGMSQASDWGRLHASLTPAGEDIWLYGAVAIVALAVLVLLTTTWAGAWRITRSWRDVAQEGAGSELRHTFFAPRFAARFLKRKLSRSLSANPIGWLQHYSPAARLVKWAWCLFVIVVEIAFSDDPGDLYRIQDALGLFLLLGLTFSATASFRNELETGAFELLLVTPIRESQLITGRTRGLWRQFLPALLVYAGGLLYLASGWSQRTMSDHAWMTLLRVMAGFSAVPLIGLFFSVHRWNFFVAWFAACLVAFLPGVLLRTIGASDGDVMFLQIITALMLALALNRRLKSRGFLQRAT